MSFQLAKIQQFNLQQVVKFASTHFSQHQVILRYLGITPEMYEGTFQPLIHACYGSGFSYAARNQGEIVSCMLALPYRKFNQVFSEIKPNSISTQLSPVVALLSQINGTYKPQNPTKTISHFIGCTNEKYRGNRFLQKLIRQIQQEGKNQGYEEYVVGCTGKGPQNIFQKLQYEQKNKINYNQFHHEGKVPFVNLIDSDSVKLMSKKWEKQGKTEKPQKTEKTDKQGKSG